MPEPDEQKAKQDVKSVDPELVGRISVRANTIINGAHFRVIELNHMKKSLVATGSFTITTAVDGVR